MSRPVQTASLFAFAICFLSFFIAAQCFSDTNGSHFMVVGEVYCDACRAKFRTRLSEPIAGATVRLECRDHEGGTVTYSTEGQTDDKGMYHLPAEQDHEDDICEVVLVKSNKPGCEENVSSSDWSRYGARVTLTNNVGMSGNVRNANPLGFLKDKADPQCKEVYRELGITGPEGTTQP